LNQANQLEPQINLNWQLQYYCIILTIANQLLLESWCSFYCPTNWRRL